MIRAWLREVWLQRDMCSWLKGMDSNLIFVFNFDFAYSFSTITLHSIWLRVKCIALAIIWDRYTISFCTISFLHIHGCSLSISHMENDWQKRANRILDKPSEWDQTISVLFHQLPLFFCILINFSFVIIFTCTNLQIFAWKKVWTH